ncbi:MAG: hypothetical protein V3R99_00495 [Thermoguttaceae bacterium]
MSFNAEVKAAIGWNWMGGATDNGRLDYAERLLEGNGNDQAEAVWHADAQSLTSGNSTTLDLTALTRTILGDTHSLTLLKVKALLLVSRSTSVGTLLVGDAASDQWSEPFGADGDQIEVPPDSPALLSNRQTGWTVDASNKNLKLSAVGGDVDYAIAVIGTTS